MVSIAISASLPRVCTSQHHVSKKKRHAHCQARPAYSSTTKNNPAPEVVSTIDVDIGGCDSLDKDTDDWNHGERLTDERWKNGTWDLNMFVKNGKMDLEGVIIARRAAMLGFFMAYVIDALTGIGIVGQSGNSICKSVLFVTVIRVLLFRQTEDVEGLRKLAEEVTLYDKERQSFIDQKRTIFS